MNDTLAYIIKKLFIGVFVVLFVSIVIFALLQMMPGDAVDMMVNERMTAERVAEIKAKWGLDKPPAVQYFYWLKNMLRGDFGTSVTTNQNVIFLISQRLPYTLMLSGLAMLIDYVLAIPLGLLAAVKRDRFFDKLSNILMILLWSVPTFWLGVVLIRYFSIKLGILPISGWSGFKSLILPALTLALPSMASTFRLTRSEVVDAMGQRHVETARAKGLHRGKILRAHILRNAIIPITVTFFLNLPWLIGGAVVVENVFAWPGMGQLLWKGISTQDFPIVQGIVFIISVLTVISNLIGDIVAGLLDPRIRLE